MTATWRDLDRYLSARGIRYGAPTAGQTTAGSHVKGSLHYSGRARDYGTSNSDARAIFAAFLPWAAGPDYVIEELFFQSDAYDKGKPIHAVAGHDDHVHVALRAGLAAFPPVGARTPDLSLSDVLGGDPKHFVPDGGVGLPTPSWMGAAGDVLANLTDPAWWRRVGLGALGVVLALGGLVVVLKDTGVAAGAARAIATKTPAGAAASIAEGIAQ